MIRTQIHLIPSPPVVCSTSRSSEVISGARNTDSALISSGADLAVWVSDPVCRDEKHAGPLVGWQGSSPPSLRAELFYFENPEDLDLLSLDLLPRPPSPSYPGAVSCSWFPTSDRPKPLSSTLPESRFLGWLQS